MKVGRRMTRQVVTVEREASLRRARRIMENRQIRHLPVVDRDRLVGLITDRDIRAAALSSATNIAPEVQEEFLDHLQVGQVMVRKVVSTTPETTIEEAALLMRQHRIGCLPVLEGERLVGIITETDIYGMFIEVLGVRASSVRLEISFHPRPGFFTDLARILDDQGVGLLSLLRVSEGEEGTILILRVDTADPTPLCQALMQAGFAIPSFESPVPGTGREK